MDGEALPSSSNPNSVIKQQLQHVDVGIEVEEIKKIGLKWAKCQENLCDPFNFYSTSSIVCSNCKEAVTKLHNNFILEYTGNEIKEMLLCSVLHLASRSTTSWKGELLNQWSDGHKNMLGFIKIIVNELQSSFFIDMETRMKLKRSATMNAEEPHKMTYVFPDEDVNIERKCDVMTCPLPPRRLIIIGNDVIHPTSFEISKNKNPYTERQCHLIHCNTHHEICKLVYHLEHMEFNIFKNCEFWLSKTSGPVTIENLREKLGERVIRGLLDYYLQIFIELNCLDIIMYRMSHKIDLLDFINVWCAFVKGRKLQRIRKILNEDEGFKNLKEMRRRKQDVQN
ncbi:unnamed protein product [Bursaphelenchus xylophilus]|uniref:(pine wood nematode) hypothetical protein n=1 Tax=Bursaphelenchus xylophilus TaxID=6326 RepID=A0A7I8WQ60_BURXY|nr:unnamed protein product [Bursaphelenchus xylophilus]CAG9096250.1 unnamed protein product [Bursaphelenchus xylophilus]